MYGYLLLALTLTQVDPVKLEHDARVDAHTLLAVMSIQTPTHIPNPCFDGYPKEDLRYIRESFHKVAVRWQILDERETRYVLAQDDPKDMDNDINLLRRRWQELKDAPMIEEAKWRLPPRASANEVITFNRKYLKYLQERLVWEQDRAQIINTVIKETETCYRHWDAIRDAQCEFYYITVRRTALQKFKCAMQNFTDEFGQKHNYWDTGEMPPYVPHWRFQERR